MKNYGRQYPCITIKETKQTTFHSLDVVVDFNCPCHQSSPCYHLCTGNMKWGNNFIDETHTSRKHIGKLYDQRQVVLKWSHTPKDAVSTKSTNITLLSVIRCRKCRLYFPASFDKKCENSLSMNLLIQHSKECHKKIVNEWNHHQSLSIKSLR